MFAKKGLHTIVGRGIVTSEYIFDTSRNPAAFQPEFAKLKNAVISHKSDKALFIIQRIKAIGE